MTCRFHRLALLPLLFITMAANEPAEVVARRGTIQLTTADIAAMLDNADPAVKAQALSSPSALADFVRERLLRRTLLTDAKAAKWDETPQVVARAEEARDAVIVQTFVAAQTQTNLPPPTEAEIKAAYEANKARFAVPKQYHVAQIAVLVPPGGSKQQDEQAKKQALELRQQVMKPKADFAEIARRNSQDKASAERGGDLGWVREDQLVPPIRSTVAAMQDNAVSEPIRSGESWHIVKLLGTRPPGTLPLEQVKPMLEQAVRQARAQQAARAYVDNLLRQEPIQLNEIELSQRFLQTR
ncbi:MAG: peptidylprolyl isomerase [Acetobacteraceae bacterium]